MGEDFLDGGPLCRDLAAAFFDEVPDSLVEVWLEDQRVVASLQIDIQIVGSEEGELQRQ